MVMLGVIAGSKHVSMQLSRTFSGLTDLLFNRRCVCNMLYISFLCTQTQGVHIYSQVPTWPLISGARTGVAAVRVCFCDMVVLLT